MIYYTAFVVNNFGENCVLIWDSISHEGFLADPGGSFDLIKKNVQNHGISIKGIVITHGHLDHIGAVHECVEFFKAPVFGPEKKDSNLLAGTHMQSLMLGLPEIEPVKPNQFLKDGEKIIIAGIEILALHTPGHTPGEMCYYIKDASLCLTGDLIFQGSVGRTDFPGGNFDDLERSIKEKIFILPKDTVLMPGHGPITTVAQEQESNPYVI